MDVFISWSGPRSEAVALALRDWLPKVIQSLRPWMSAADIEKGTRWASEMAGVLERCSVGVICLTPENIVAPWVLFEAGALPKFLDGTHVIPLLYELTPAQLEGPLTQFQGVSTTKQDLLSLIETINNVTGDNALKDNQLNDTFEMWWPSLEKALENITPATEEHAPIRPDREVLEEVLSLVREQSRQAQRIMTSYSFLSPDDVFNDDDPGQSQSVIPLTPIQRQILAMTIDGKKSHDIASELALTVKTVQRYWLSIIQTLGVHSRTEAVTKAFRLGLISYPTREFSP